MADRPQPWPGSVEAAHPDLLRQIRQEQEWLRCQDNLEKYAGQVVAIGGAVVRGYGGDHETAVRNAEKALASTTADKPSPEDLVYVAVPDLLTPEDPLSDY